MNGTLTLAIFGIILLGLGITILIHAISMKKKEEVPDLFVNAVEMKNCKDNAGFARELFPATLIFALVCIAFGIEEFLNIFFSFPKIETAIALGIFILSWGYFSAVLRKKRDKYCGKL